MPPDHMDAGALAAFGHRRDVGFYLTALTYGQYLWQRGLAARSILCLDRAFAADLRGDEPELASWPLPYAPLAWIMHNTPADVFIGNPRVHYQHLADRMNEPRREQRSWRAWACWCLVRSIRPEFAPDPRHSVKEPSETEIRIHLDRVGLPGERMLWVSVLYADFPSSARL